MIDGSDALGAAALAGGFLLLLTAVELWTRRSQPPPEATRKAVHLGGGAAALAIPFLVKSPWTVLVLALAMSAVLALGSRTGILRCLTRVGRRTHGSEYYPLAVFLVFVMSAGVNWIYLCSILTLAVSDAFAALVGISYGRIRYLVEDERKSLEGSLAFLVITFIVVLLPTLLMTDLPRPICVLSASLVAVLVTGFEAVSLRGSDNLFVPVAVCLVLGKITTKPLGENIYQNVSLVAICLGIGVLSWRFRTFNVGGTITLVLFAYGAWSLGSRMWALPVLLGLVVYMLFQFALPGPIRGFPDVRVRVMFHALLPSITMLMLANSTSLYGFFYGPYIATCAAAPALAIWSLSGSLVTAKNGWRLARAALTGILVSCAVCLLPWLFQGLGPGPLLAAMACTGLAVAADSLIEPHERPQQGVRLWPGRRLVVMYGLCAVLMLLQLAGLPLLWRHDGIWPG